MNGYSIRLGRHAELERLRDIERLAGRAFADIDMAAVAADEPPSVAVLAAYCADARLWVVVDAADCCVAHLIAEQVDDGAHIEQVSVDPEHAGQGLGHELMQTVVAWALEHELPAVTLTTFRDVAWNAPYYERLGFRVVPPDQLTPGLARIRARERALGLDRWPRVCMRLAVQQ